MIVLTVFYEANVLPVALLADRLASRSTKEKTVFTTGDSALNAGMGIGFRT
jgi:hypothetical protein